MSVSDLASVESALSTHQRAGLIRSWKRVPRGKGHEITMSDGKVFTTATLFESRAFAKAMAVTAAAAYCACCADNECECHGKKIGVEGDFQRRH